MQELLIGDYGLITMALTYSIAIVLPIVGFFFIAFGLLEDSGYLPRLAVMVNKIFKIMGLNGKAVLPMILGLGCDTMATLTTRILETRKERILVTLLLALGVPCSAQLGVVLGMVSGISGFATVIWIGTVVLVMLLVGLSCGKGHTRRTVGFCSRAAADPGAAADEYPGQDPCPGAVVFERSGAAFHPRNAHPLCWTQGRRA